MHLRYTNILRKCHSFRNDANVCSAKCRRAKQGEETQRVKNEVGVVYCLDQQKGCQWINENWTVINRGERITVRNSSVISLF